MCDALVKVHALACWWLQRCLHQVAFRLAEKVRQVAFWLTEKVRQVAFWLSEKIRGCCPHLRHIKRLL